MPMHAALEGMLYFLTPGMDASNTAEGSVASHLENAVGERGYEAQAVQRSDCIVMSGILAAAQQLITNPAPANLTQPQ